jgi:hypothetical protein
MPEAFLPADSPLEQELPAASCDDQLDWKSKLEL